MVCKQLIPYERVAKVVELGTKLMSAQQNVENILVPGATFEDFMNNLPKDIKEKLPSDFSLQSLATMKPVELKGGSQIPNHPHLILVGDTHGTFEVLENIFSKEGLPQNDIIYLFNGDYVDRGNFSVEIVVALLVFKLLNNKCLYMLRGNHEIQSICQ